MEPAVQGTVDVSAYGAFGIGVFVEVEEAFFFQIFRRLIDIKEGNVLWLFGQEGAAGAAVDGN